MTSVVGDIRNGRALVSESLFERLVARIVNDHDVARERAELVMDQALAFLGTCAVTEVPMSPTDAVDIGWHTFILHTREYKEFCERVAGRYIHHVPNDEDDPTTHGAAARAVIERTVSEIRRAGFVVDVELWQPVGNRCSQCHGGCTDSPRSISSTLA